MSSSSGTGVGEGCAEYERPFALRRRSRASGVHRESAERARADCPRPFPKSAAVLLSGCRAALWAVSALTSEPRIDESVRVAIGARFSVSIFGGGCLRTGRRDVSGNVDVQCVEPYLPNAMSD